MSLTKKIMAGLFILFISGTSILYIQFSSSARIRVDLDGSTFYVPHEKYSWLWTVSGEEKIRLFDGGNLLNRDLSKTSTKWEVFRQNTWQPIEFEELEDYEGLMRAVLTTTYRRGPVVTEKWVFDNRLDDIELFPISHQVNVKGAKDKFLRYTVDRLSETGPKRKLTDGLSLDFGKNMKVDLNPNYRWAWIGWPYGSDSLSAQYEITSDDQNFNFRLFDPIAGQSLVLNDGKLVLKDGVFRLR